MYVKLLGKTISYGVWMNIVVNIFIAAFINFCQHFTEIPKNTDFWMKSPFIWKKNKFLLVNFHETRSQKTKKDFEEVYRRTILKDENHLVLEKISSLPIF